LGERRVRNAKVEGSIPFRSTNLPSDPQMPRLIALALSCLALSAVATSPARAASDEQLRWQLATQNTRIVRDDWGIAHVHGKTDADAVFGMIYAQAEDDFNRVETNYLNAMGRLAEAEGESAIYRDLRMKLFMDPVDLKKRYATSPPWLQSLMVAWADGLNCFLASHPKVTPRVIRHFEPWMALSFSEGSIGGDIAQVALDPLQAFYSGAPALARTLDAAGDTSSDPGGSNGIAIAPSHTASHHALLLINPHTSFSFRSELQMSSDEGLNVYGAATWGQFFIYQGWNERVGWMHTTSYVDSVDFFLETVVRNNGRLYYRYGRQLRPVVTSTIRIPYRDSSGSEAVRSFTVYRTQHGPIIRKQGEQWVSVALMYKPVEALSQSFLLTKARDHASFMKVMEFKANSSNNTIYADADGQIAYMHPQFVPRRDDRFDYTRPVDGADPATDWKDLHALSELPQVLNPASGWVMNTNDWPYSAAGPDSPRRENFPRYMDTAGENPRGVHATMLLQNRSGFTPDSLNSAAYDSLLPAFLNLIPALLGAYDGLEATHPLRARLADPIQVLRGWDERWSVHSVATTLAALWGDGLWDQVSQKLETERSAYDFMANQTSAEQKLNVLAEVCDRLQRDFGTWRVPWGQMNRAQRLTGDIVQPFSDASPSIPVGFTSSRWGSLASFGARRYPGTKRYYGDDGNSFVAIVEFGDKVSARAISVGGESGDPKSIHFDDQTARYADGALRPVYFYSADLIGHVEREYRPE
jgi:acyl-homoserine-lactone acylase